MDVFESDPVAWCSHGAAGSAGSATAPVEGARSEKLGALLEPGSDRDEARRDEDAPARHERSSVKALLFLLFVACLLSFDAMKRSVKNGSTPKDDGAVKASSVNPFIYQRQRRMSSYQCFKTAAFTLILLPIRVVAIAYLVITAWLLACVGLLGVSEEELFSKPLTGWRRKLRALTCLFMKWTYLCAGFTNVRVKGRQASFLEAPFLAVAPHSSFIDAIVPVVCGAPSIVAKASYKEVPLLNKITNFTQPIYVWRDDPDSRVKSIKKIVERAHSKLDWPQILIFPEGTCTNRSCLITFKPGAFYAAVPVQPVCVRYPNKRDTVTWTWEGPGVMKQLWMTLTQVQSICEVEFLPVYYPSEMEKKHPRLYANNVRNVMAKAMGLPVSDYTYDDCRLILRAQQLNLPNAAHLVEVQKLRAKLGLDKTNIEEEIIESGVLTGKYWKITFVEFAQYLKIDPNNVDLQQLFRIYDTHSVGIIDFQKYLMGVIGVSKSDNMIETLRLAFKLYDRTGSGCLTPSDFTKALNNTMSVRDNTALEIYDVLEATEPGQVTFDRFMNYAVRVPYFETFLKPHPSTSGGV